MDTQENPTILKYIDTKIEEKIDGAVDRAVVRHGLVTKKDLERELEKNRKETVEEIKRHNTALLGSFNESIRGMSEIISSKPSEERVREIVKEEVKPIVINLDLVVKEVGVINREMRRNNDEMKKLRKEHNKRLTRLENVVL